MKIGDAAQASGLSVKSVRYYADIDLVAPAGRAEGSGYRAYGPEEIAKLRLVRRARGFGFTIEECRALVALFGDAGRASADVKRIAQAKRADLDRKLAELQALKEELDRMIEACPGDGGADCAILDRLAATKD